MKAPGLGSGTNGPNSMQFLLQARALMRAPEAGHADLGGTWPRAVALLARQALEQGLDDFWGARAPRVREASRHAQMLCLGAYLQDDGVVSGVRYAWHGLSRACHHQVYELPPTATELERWLDAVDALVAYDPIRPAPSSRPRHRSPA
jgi:hypothetical protein